MLAIYLKIALRNLTRDRLFSGINLISLSVGMATTLLIALWVQNELRYDGYHRNAAQIYRITTDLKINPTEYWYWSQTPLRMTELTAQVPGIIQVAQVQSDSYVEIVLRRGAMNFLEKNAAWVNENWFKTFDYQVKEGTLASFADHATNIVLTQKRAAQIFGNHPAIGETIRIDTLDYTVCAVLADPQPQSSFQYDVYIPAKVLLINPEKRENENSWNNFNYQAFVELHESVDHQVVASKLTQLLLAEKKDSNIVLGLQPLLDVHFDTKYQDEFRKGSRAQVNVFALIGLLILGMACINYVSLTTARAAIRAREMSIKKVNGAGNGHVFGQMLSESGFLAVLASGIALILVKISLPLFNQLTDQQFNFDILSPLGLALIGGAFLLVVLLSGLYPAWLMSRFQPITILRGQGLAIHTKSPLRQGLVVTQFAISGALMLCTIVIWQQRQYMQNKPLGYDFSNTLTFTTRWDGWQNQGAEKGRALRDALERDLRQEASISKVSIASQPPVNLQSTHSGSVKYDGMPEGDAPTVSQVSADEHFADVFDLKMAEGRWFEPHNKADEDNVVLNETACREFNLKQPWAGQPFEYLGRKGKIIGVVRDFHFKSMHHKIAPLVAFNQPLGRLHFFVKPHDGAEKQALAAIENLWKKHFPEQPFQYKYLSDNYDKLYGSERRASLLFNVFAGLAIFISCMGLFGLAVFVSGQRTKEIGIRKVLGATTVGITGLLARDFMVLVVVAIVLACPIAYYAMQSWLEEYAYRIAIQWWMFAAAALAALAIASLAVGFQSIKAALANPVKSLRSE